MRNKFNQIPKPKPKAKVGVVVNPAVTKKTADLLQQGLALHNAGQLEQAKVIYEEILKLNPKHFDALQLSGALEGQLHNWVKSINYFKLAIEVNSSIDFLHVNLGLAYLNEKKYKDSFTEFEKAFTINAKNISAYINCAKMLRDLNRSNEAIIILDKAIEQNPDNFQIYFEKGFILSYLNNSQAIENYSKCISLNPQYSIAYFNLGRIYQEQNNIELAILNYKSAIKFQINYTKAQINLGTIYFKRRNFQDAIKYFQQALLSDDKESSIYNNLGLTYKELGDFNKALINYQKSILLNDRYAEAFSNLGILLAELKDYKNSLKNYLKAYEINPDYEYLLGTIINSKMNVCDWENFEYFVNNIIIKIKNNEKCSPCFSLLSLPIIPPLIKTNAEIWSNHKHPSNANLILTKTRSLNNKLKIGYFSSDFRNHPVSYLITELFELHNRNTFEVIVFSYGPKSNSDITKRITNNVDFFFDITNKSDEEVALISKEINIDIAIDLTGHTQHARTGIFSHRAAPIQLSYIGYLGTMGAEYYDYLIADKTIIPVESQQYYKEKIIYLPSYQVNDSKREIADKIFTKLELNLPENGFVFCCFNNNYKITPPTFDGWMRILNAVPDSVLFLYADNKWAEDNLKLEAEKRGVSQTRLVFGARIGRSEYLARYRAADLFLDTLPYNAGTTASDALWAGLPVLTCMGESFASRVAASLLNAIELPELITTTQEQYEATAIELATNPTKLKEIKDKLERNRLTTALFDTPRFTKHIEAAYMQMYERYQADLPPDHIYIEA